MTKLAVVKTAAAAKTPGPEIDMARTILLSVTRRRMGTERVVRGAGVAVDAAPAGSPEVDRGMVRITKSLLDCKELDAIDSHLGKIKSYLDGMGSRSLFRDGVYLLALALVEEVDAKLEQYAADLEKLKTGLLRAYEKRRAEALVRLGPVGDPSDYPEPETVAAMFGVEWEYISLDVPRSLKAMKRGIYQKAQRKAEARMAAAAEEVQTALRTAFADFVERITERLTGADDDGKPKVFRDTMVTKLEEFLRTFAARNLTDDAALGALVQQARAVIAGVDPETLRKQGDVRARVGAAFATIQASLTPMLKDRPTRKYRREEEPAGA